MVFNRALIYFANKEIAFCAGAFGRILQDFSSSRKQSGRLARRRCAPRLPARAASARIGASPRRRDGALRRRASGAPATSRSRHRAPCPEIETPHQPPTGRWQLMISHSGFRGLSHLGTASSRNARQGYRKLSTAAPSAQTPPLWPLLKRLPCRGRCRREDGAAIENGSATKLALARK